MSAIQLRQSLLGGTELSMCDPETQRIVEQHQEQLPGKGKWASLIVFQESTNGQWTAKLLVDGKPVNVIYSEEFGFDVKK